MQTIRQIEIIKSTRNYDVQIIILFFLIYNRTVFFLGKATRRVGDNGSSSQYAPSIDFVLGEYKLTFS